MPEIRPMWGRIVSTIFRAFAFSTLGALGISCLGSVISTNTIVVGPPEPIRIKTPPSFAIAEFGYGHQLGATYFPGFYIYEPDSSVPAYGFRYELLSEVPGMSLDEDGNLSFLPAVEQAGQSYIADVRVTVYDGDAEVFSDVASFETRVIAEIPKLTVSPVAGRAFGTFGNAGTKYAYGLDVELSDDDLRFFRFSLIDPPTGVHLDLYSPYYTFGFYVTGLGPAIVYPEGEFGEGITQVPIRLRYELDTLEGVLSDEIESMQEILPPPPNGNLGTWNRTGNGFGACFGFSVASDADWLIAGEPYIGDQGPMAPGGRAHIWRVDAATGDLALETILESSSGNPGEAFGGSVAVRTAGGGLTTAAVISAPEAPGGSDGDLLNVGRVDVFERAGESGWNHVASLHPEVPQAGLYFGGWVDIDDAIIVASMEGIDTEGANTGALAVFRRDQGSSGGRPAQVLTAPDAGAGDYFSYPCAVDGDWIAAAANEDDAAGVDAGAVHLYENVAGRFIHRQKLLPPEPQAGALFGERIELSGEWLLVSAFRQNRNEGAVYAYRLINGIWVFQQRLYQPFTTEFSGFGSSLSIHGDTLSVSAPGNLAGPDDDPWIGLTLYRLVDGCWKWANQRPGENFSRNEAFGFALAQITGQHTVTGVPFENLNQGRSLGGRIIRWDWPDLTPQTFERAIRQLPADAQASDDLDRNGIPNRIQWAMGQDIDSVSSRWRSYPSTSRPFLEFDGNEVRFMIPPLTRGWEFDAKVMLSTDCIHWEEAQGIQWEQVRTYPFPISLGGVPAGFMAPVQPIVIPKPEGMDRVFIRLDLR